MSIANARKAVETGIRLALDLAESYDVFGTGEMGIGNTTAAAALACAYMELSPRTLVWPGTGLDAAGVARKAEVVSRALSLHRSRCSTPLEVLRHYGGFEIAAMCGAMLDCAQRGLAVLVDSDA